LSLAEFKKADAKKKSTKTGTNQSKLRKYGE